MSVLEFDHLPRIELRRRSNLNPNLIAISWKPDRRFPGHTSHLSSIKVAGIAVATGKYTDPMPAHSLPFYLVF